MSERKRELKVTNIFSENGMTFRDKMKDLLKNKNFLNAILLHAQKQVNDGVCEK